MTTKNTKIIYIKLNIIHIYLKRYNKNYCNLIDILIVIFIRISLLFYLIFTSFILKFS